MPNLLSNLVSCRGLNKREKPSGQKAVGWVNQIGPKKEEKIKIRTAVWIIIEGRSVIEIQTVGVHGRIDEPCFGGVQGRSRNLHRFVWN